MRYYAWYSSVQRGRRRRQGLEKLPLGAIPLADDSACAKTARGNWARFIKKVFAADPLVCPDCHGPMRIVAFIEEPRVVRAILEHLSLWAAPQARPPPLANIGPADFEYVPCED